MKTYSHQNVYIYARSSTRHGEAGVATSRVSVRRGTDARGVARAHPGESLGLKQQEALTLTATWAGPEHLTLEETLDGGATACDPRHVERPGTSTEAGRGFVSVRDWGGGNGNRRLRARGFFLG